jgi:hypothetical protein
VSHNLRERSDRILLRTLYGVRLRTNIQIYLSYKYGVLCILLCVLLLCRYCPQSTINVHIVAAAKAHPVLECSCSIRSTLCVLPSTYKYIHTSLRRQFVCLPKALPNRNLLGPFSVGQLYASR